MKAQVTTILADGGSATVLATRRPRQGRADVKCSVGASGVDGEGPSADIERRMAQVVRLARHTEARVDSRDQVVISVERAPGPRERDWELAVVLADRMVRGLWQAAGPVVACGWSDQWQLGRIGGHDVCAAPAHALLGGTLGHLGALTGQPDAAAAVGSARAWFPVYSGGLHDALCWVEVSVYPLDARASTGLDGAALEEEETIGVPQLDAPGQRAVRQALVGSRHFDCGGRGLGRWRTVVRFEQPRFQGNSYELALVMADRLARGREFVPRGRIIASGASSAWHAGRVEAVEACAAKCALIARQAVAGDRVLLPASWGAELPAGFGAALRDRGASVALVERVGIV